MRLYIISFILLSVIVSCDHFEEINTNPDGSTKASRSLLASNVILNLTSSDYGKPFYYNQLVSKYLAWAENADGNQYNAFNRSGFGAYSIIIDAEKMLELTTDQNKAAFEGLYYFARAYKMFYLTLEVGDIPYSEAFKGEEGIVKPKYDTQKEVVLAILDDLEKAYSAFSERIPLEGDPVYSGDPEKWIKVTRALQLKVLMNLSKKENDPDLNLINRFKKYAESDLMLSNADNFTRTYSDNSKEYYPIYYTRLNHNPYAMLSDVLVDKLKETGDFRLFYFGRPAASQVAKGVKKDDFEAFMGIDPSLSFDIVKDRWGDGEFSGINDRYTQNPAGEPVIKIGYAEQQFILAEAALRGWIDEDPQVYYEEGIRAAMEFVADHTPDNEDYHYGRKISEENISEVINHDNNKLQGDFDFDLKRIIYQKYLSSFMNREWDSYYDYRRTGYPEFPINPSTNQNIDNTKMPMRWMYPSSEYGYNSENVTAAVDRQWQGKDDVNQLIWVLQD